MMLLLPSLDLCFSQDKFLEQGKDAVNLKNLEGCISVDFMKSYNTGFIPIVSLQITIQSDNKESESNTPFFITVIY